MQQKQCQNSCNSDTAMDCADILHAGHTKSGVMTIWPKSRVIEGSPLNVYCDMKTDGGGWTVIQRRGNFSRPKDFFTKGWSEYKKGFGNVEKDFWLGNDNIFALSNQKMYSVRFDLKDVEGNTRYAMYDLFWIDDEDHQYTLHIKDYSGDAGDSMIAQHDGQKFSTKDKDNDNMPEEFCSERYKGGWWYNKCHHSNLNGLYLGGKHESFADGVNWLTWKGYKESLAETEIKIRPRRFVKVSQTRFVETPMH
ncbi:techylectin-5A-like isoform X2 [Uloborus diversus]|uniref:techylectin-5A-like isoform X2 n=1 Tax=Uloborus diversus TaxID=327109 RepID=UPI002409D6FE|nr:techylectin-5A-like isoform X2 [Uloborus diversus]